MKKIFNSQAQTLIALLLVIGLLSLVAVSLPGESSLASNKTGPRTRIVDETGAEVAEDGSVLAENAGGDVAKNAAEKKSVSSKSATAASAGACKAGQNGGATDVGVTGTEIRLATTVVQSGVGASFLGDSPKAMQAVAQKVNRQGGICGRLIKLVKVTDDGWNAKLGGGFLRNFIQSKSYFALPVVPSSEGLTAAIEAKDISAGKIPVIGTDGMLRQQYQEDWVWPVATATESTMRAMAKHAHDAGARTFGIVFDNEYRFGKEGAAAFKKYVETLPGAQLKSFRGIMPAQSSYGSELEKFNGECNPCDMVAMLLEPSTAETWVAGHPTRGKIVTSGAQTLFNRRFAQNCRSACQDMLVWTGYNPPIDALSSLPGVAEYVNDLRSVDPGVDVTNAFVEGAYLGMTAFVEGLKRVGPNLTRDRLREVMDSMTYETDLASTLTWSADNHYANTRAQAFSLQYAGDGFSGFRNEQTGWIRDPNFAS